MASYETMKYDVIIKVNNSKLIIRGKGGRSFIFRLLKSILFFGNWISLYFLNLL